VGDGGGEGAVDGGGEGLGVQGEEAAHWLSRPRGVDGDEGSGGGSAHARRLWSGRLAAGLPPTVKGGQRGVGSMAGADDDDREEGEEEEGVGDDNMMVTPLGATDAVSRAAPSTGKYSHGALEVASRHALAQHEQGSRALAQHTCEALPAASRCTLCQNELARAEAAGAWAGEQYECRRCLNLSELLQQLHTNCVQAMHEAEQAVVYQQHLQLDLHQRLQDERQACEQALEQATLMQDKVRLETELERVREELQQAAAGASLHRELEHSRTVHHLHAQIDALRLEHDTQQQQTFDLQASLRELEAAWRGVEEQKIQIEEELSSWKSRYEELVGTRAVMEAAVCEASGRIAALEAEVQQLTETCSELEASHRPCAEEMLSLHRELASLRKARDADGQTLAQMMNPVTNPPQTRPSSPHRQPPHSLSLLKDAGGSAAAVSRGSTGCVKGAEMLGGVDQMAQGKEAGSVKRASADLDLLSNLRWGLGLVFSV